MSKESEKFIDSMKTIDVLNEDNFKKVLNTLKYNWYDGHPVRSVDYSSLEKNLLRGDREGDLVIHFIHASAQSVIVNKLLNDMMDWMTAHEQYQGLCSHKNFYLSTDGRDWYAGWLHIRSTYSNDRPGETLIGKSSSKFVAVFEMMLEVIKDTEDSLKRRGKKKDETTGEEVELVDMTEDEVVKLFQTYKKLKFKNINQYILKLTDENPNVKMRNKDLKRLAKLVFKEK